MFNPPKDSIVKFKISLSNTLRHYEYDYIIINIKPEKCKNEIYKKYFKKLGALF